MGIKEQEEEGKEEEEEGKEEEEGEEEEEGRCMHYWRREGVRKLIN